MNEARVKKALTNTITHFILIIIALTCLFPVFWMISSSLKTQHEIFTQTNLLPRHWNFSNYAEVWTKAEFGRYFLNSVMYTVFGVLGVVFISSLAAYGFALGSLSGRAHRQAAQQEHRWSVARRRGLLDRRAAEPHRRGRAERHRKVDPVADPGRARSAR